MSVLKYAKNGAYLLMRMVGAKGQRGGDGTDGTDYGPGPAGPNGAPQGVTFRRGTVSITPAAGTPSGVTVAFTPNFAVGEVPAVFTTARTTVPGTTVLATGCKAGPDHTGAFITVTHTNTTATTVHWIAAGVGEPTTK